MGSETGKSQSSGKPAKDLGMSPGESLARYGSMAGGGLKPEQVSNQIARINELRQAQGREPSYTAQDLLTDKTATEMKYGRQANLNPLARDDSGRTITPSMLDASGNIRAFTAAPPTIGQLFGDMGRAFTGGTAFTKAAGLPNPSDAQGIMALATKASPLLNFLGVDFSPATGPSTMSMARDYVNQMGMFAPKQPVGIESVSTQKAPSNFQDLTPKEILETPLESIDDIVKTFRQSQLIEDMVQYDEPLEAAQYMDMPAYKKAIEYYRKYPEIYNQVINQQLGNSSVPMI